MSAILETAGGLWRKVSSLFTARRETDPIDSVVTLEAFVATRAAFHAQKTLYGYVKARMGIRYPAMFEDAFEATSICVVIEGFGDCALILLGLQMFSGPCAKFTDGLLQDRRQRCGASGRISHSVSLSSWGGLAQRNPPFHCVNMAGYAFG